ncbi:MAG: hypothetical protein J5910_08330 [Lachnospiraceae bacterium]|nr:hypothetical protein [Lachnospiraceae bacterium]
MGVKMRAIYYGDYNYMIRVDEQRSRRKARTRQVRRQKLLVIGLLITIALVLFCSIRAFAGTSEDSEGNVSKTYRSIKIYCHDTVESIAEENFCTNYSTVDKMADEIRHINHLSADETLIPGNYIVIPVCESSVY